MRDSARSLQSKTAYLIIKRAIISCELAPGSQISETRLADLHGLGRASIRVALNRLYQERLVEPVPRQGYIIAPITMKDVADLYDLRLLLEPYAARLAATRIHVEQIRQLRDLCEIPIPLNDPKGIEEYLRLNTEFHVAIARASGNERLVEISAKLLESMERIFHLGLMQPRRVDEMFYRHRDLIEALAAGDGERAEQGEIARITASREMFVETLFSLSSARLISLVLP